MPEDAIRIVKEANNFASFNPMQEKAIKAGVLEKSLIVSSPTASGKTILAEIAALNSVLNKGKKVVYTCPLRALASEHFNDFKTKYSQAHSIKAVLSTGDFDSSGSYLSNKDVIFTTYERLNSLITHKAEWLGQIGLLVVDEIHVLGSDRGPALEMLVTKLRFLNKEMQILGLSATIPNAKELAEWLGAVLVESDFRPVKLKEGILLESSLFFGSSKQELIPEKDSVSTVALDTLEKGKQALIFTNTRKSSEFHAKKLAPIVSRRLSAEEKKVLEKFSEKALNVLEQPTTQCRTLASLIKEGVCFHNAGLLQKQREIIEELFRKNFLKFICSTPTLAAGINMPAFRVVITSPYRYAGFGMERIPVSEFKQMSGRAGRPKYDSEGEALLLAKTEMEKDDFTDFFINGEVESVDSMLENDSQLRFHLLAAIAGGFIFDLDSAEKFFSATFYAKQSGNLSALFGKVTKLVSGLEEMGFVKSSDKRIDATVLGRRVAELYLDPLSAFSIINSLKRRKFNDLSYLYSISSISEFYPLLSVPKSSEPELWERLQEEKHLLPVDVDSEMFYDNDLLSKYKTSLMLLDWIEEVREQSLFDSFKVQPGILRAKLQNADWIVYSALELAKLLALEEHFAPLGIMRKRLKAGIRKELVMLCELRGIGRVRARRLFNAGVKTIADVKKTDVKDLEKILSPKIAISVKQQLALKK